MRRLILLLVISSAMVGCAQFANMFKTVTFKLGDTEEYVVSVNGQPYFTEMYYDNGEPISVYIYKTSGDNTVFDTHTVTYKRYHFRKGILIKTSLEEDTITKKEKNVKVVTKE